MTSMSGARDERRNGTNAGSAPAPSWFARLNGWRERRTLRRALARMDAHLWADLGFDEAAAREEMEKPFWKE